MMDAVEHAVAVDSTNSRFVVRWCMLTFDLGVHYYDTLLIKITVAENTARITVFSATAISMTGVS